MNYILYSIGLLIGSFFPDIDQKIKWLRHRSILTHSAIIPVILAISLKGEKELLLISGFCVGMAMHKLFDLFPKKWQGYALIRPFDKFGTILFMMSSMAIELIITMINFIGEKNYIIYAVITTIIFITTLEKEKKKLAPASIYIAIAGPIFWTFLKGVILKVL